MITKLLFTLTTGIIVNMNLAIAQDTIKILHYNIKELDTVKINSGSNGQFMAIKRILSNHQYDILSLNEIQYDLPEVPTKSEQTHGRNLEKLRASLGIKGLKNEAFYPANTGNNAIPMKNGDYYQNPAEPKARDNADMVNFGTMPSQYSTGALFKYKKIKEVVITDLKWKEFNPTLNLSLFADAKGNPLPKDMELFDKNFTDVTVDVNGKELHIILLHTVPAFHFGNTKSVNYKRNADQLRFLEWYLTGSTDFDVKLKNIKPLKKNSYYVAAGDFNTSYHDTKNPGSEVLRRIFTKSKLWMKSEKDLSFTNEGHGYGDKPFRLMLDYIAYSKNIDLIEGKILHPKFERIQLGCNSNSSVKKPKDMIKVTWENSGKTCSAYVHPEYKDYKDASDHYPIWGHFKLR